MRRWIPALVTASVLTGAAPAQAAGWNFKWQPGQVLTFRIEQVTTAEETIGETKTESTARVNNVKRWQVLDMDPAGVATLQLSLVSLRIETRTPKGEVFLFDSAAPDQSDPQMREQLSAFVGKPLAVVRVDGKGKVLAVEKSVQAFPSRFEAEPPLVLTLPDAVPQAGHGWERAYPITLEPPQGTGEKYQAVQKYSCREVTATTGTIQLTTQLKSYPEAVADRMPLLPLMWEGTVVFDHQLGCLRSARLKVDQELKDHQGPGSNYRFQNSYVEEYLGAE